MRTNKTLLIVSTLAGLTLCVALSARNTSAQGPGGPPPPGGGNFQRPPGGPGGFGGPPPFAIGTITGGDQNAGRITIQSQFGGNAQTIQVTNTTQIVTQTEVKATDLQVNDQVQVQGVPTGITASSITAGQMPNFMPGGGRFRPGGNPGGPGANPASAFASATGSITATNPLTVSLGNNISLTVKLASNARITKIAPTAFNNLKVGDRVMAMGQAGNDGTFAATSIAVNMDMGFGMGPGMGRGGFGPGGPGGRRGPGGLPPPAPGAPGSPNP